jgi:hypothetical protein
MLAALAACATSADDPRPPAVDPAAVMLDPAPLSLADQKQTNAAPGFDTVTWNGGPVISTAQVSVVYWNAAVAFQSALPGFYASVTNSSYISWLAEYNTPTQWIGRGSLAQVVVDPSPPGGFVDTDTIANELRRLINNGTLAQPGPNRLYMVHMPPGLQFFAGGTPSCTPTSGFCGVHAMFVHNGVNAYFGVIADLAPCGSWCGPGDAFANTTATASHEVIEAITDPARTGWYDGTSRPPDHVEISDICQDQQAIVAGYTVMRGWSEQQQACVVSDPCQACRPGTFCQCGETVCRPPQPMCF